MRCIPLRTLTLVLSLASLAPAAAPTTTPAPAPTPAPTPAWGDPRSGLQAGAALEGDAVAGQQFRLRGFLRNDAVAGLPVAGAFAWVLIAADPPLYTQRFPLAQLLHEPLIPPGQAREFSLDLGSADSHLSAKGMKVLAGYPATDAPDTPAAPLLSRLKPGKLRLQLFVYLPSAGGEKLLLKSAPLNVSLSAPQTRPADPGSLDELAAAFRRDPFAAKAAYDRAVKLGAPARPAVASVAFDPAAPSFARDWAIATLADIGGDESAAILVRLLDASPYVIAYYSPALKNAQLDAALNQRADKMQDPVFLAWLARGYARAARSIPNQLAEKAVASNSLPARIEVAEALAKSSDPRQRELLIRLLLDKDAPVRTKAARICADHKVKDAPILQALVKALELPGDEPRSAACDALARATGLQWRLDENQSPAQKEAILNRWRAWARHPELRP